MLCHRVKRPGLNPDEHCRRISHNFLYERLTDAIRVPPGYMNAMKRSSARTVSVWGS